MIKVKEFLDANFQHKNVINKDGTSSPASTATLKSNGQYDVHGSWLYSVKQEKGLEYKYRAPLLCDNCISCSCIGEVLNIDIIVDGKKVGYYNSITTSKSVPVGEADERGFYDRWSDKEVIHYLQSYVDILNKLK